jgi:hypothetical protein
MYRRVFFIAFLGAVYSSGREPYRHCQAAKTSAAPATLRSMGQDYYGNQMCVAYY